MYAHAKKSSLVEATVLVGKLSDGGTVILNRAEVFQPFASGRMQQKLSALHHKAAHDDFSRALYEHALKSVAKLYSSRLPDSAITAVEVYTIRIDAKDIFSGSIQIPKNQKPDWVLSVW